MIIVVVFINVIKALISINMIIINGNLIKIIQLIMN